MIGKRCSNKISSKKFHPNIEIFIVTELCKSLHYFSLECVFESRNPHWRIEEESCKSSRITRFDGIWKFSFLTILLQLFLLIRKTSKKSVRWLIKSINNNPEIPFKSRPAWKNRLVNSTSICPIKKPFIKIILKFWETPLQTTQFT